MSKNFVIGLYDNESTLVKAINKLHDMKVKVYDVFSPYPIHKLYSVMEIKRSKLPIVSFIFGTVGLGLALYFQKWIFDSWPLNVGGKPIGWQSIPSFIPVGFEVMALFAAFSMAGAFFIKSKLYPSFKKIKIPDLGVTNNLFAVAIDFEELPFDSKESVKSLLKENGALKVYEKKIAL